MTKLSGAILAGESRPEGRGTGTVPSKRAICAHVLLLCLALVQPALAMDLQLTGKTALVTGSTRGIGYGIAKTLLHEGAQVIINGRTADSVAQAAASLKQATGKTPLTFTGDMSKAEDIERLTRTFPTVDILVNNVGRFVSREFTQSTDQDWYDSFDLNVMSGVRLSRFYLPGMKQRNWGRIIFISSESALQIPLESVQYGMTKAAEIAIARGLAESCAKTGVTVNSILPGPTFDSDDARAAARFGDRSQAQVEEEFFKTRRPTSLIKRFERTEEVASLVAYVASPLSSATTGAALRVDGGVVKSAF